MLVKDPHFADYNKIKLIYDISSKELCILCFPSYSFYSLYLYWW